MSATDELRRLLDERGVEWKDGDAAYTVEWHTPDGRHCSAIYWHPEYSVCISDCTPEQAIEATLGRRTCHVETTENWLPAERYHRCKHCGAFFAVLDASGDIPPRVCPNCGRKVVVE